MAAGGNPLNVDLGPGRLYVAPLGTAEPASASAALPTADWRVIGYTDTGTTFSSEVTSEPVEVAEESDPIAYEQTRRITTVAFAMAETTKRRLWLALGGGAAGNDDTIPFEPPAPSAVVPVMIIWDSEDNPAVNTNRRWLFRRCTPSGAVSSASQKAPQKRLLPVTFDCAKPSTSTEAFKIFPNVNGQI